MNYSLKRIVSFAAILFAVNAGYAQGIAGEDRYIPLKEGEPEPVTLTAAGSGGTCCYQWSTSDGIIIGESDKQSIKIKPKSPSSTFHVTRSCTSGTESDDVTVYYEDFSIVSVTPKKNCYKGGDEIKLNDFNIITNPRGYEKSVKTDPGYYPSKWWNPYSLEGSYIVSVKFYENHGIYSEYVVNDILVVSPVSQSVGRNKWGEDLERDMNKAFDLIESIIDGVDFIFKATKTCKFPKDCNDRKISLDMSWQPICCVTGPDWNIAVKLSGSVKYCLECQIPFPGLTVGWAGVNIIGGISASASLSASVNVSTCDENSRLKVQLSPRGEVFGGVEVEVLSDKILECQAKLIGYLSCTELQVEFFPYKPGSFKTCAGAELEFNAKLLSFINAKKTIKIGEKCWWSK